MAHEGRVILQTSRTSALSQEPIPFFLVGNSSLPRLMHADMCTCSWALQELLYGCCPMNILGP